MRIVEDRADRNLLKFSKQKCKVLYLGRYNPTHQYTLGADLQETHSAEKDLVDTKVAKSQQHALMGAEAF